MFKARCFLIVAIIAVTTLSSDTAFAQKHIQILEEEINLLKETIEANNRQIRKLAERVVTVEEQSDARIKAIRDLRKHIKRIDVLTKELQELEAKLTESKSTGGSDAAKLGMNAEVRLRPEFTANRTDLNSDLEDEDAFWGQRIRIGADFGMDSWVRARVQMQDARTFGDRQGNLGNLGIHQAWLELEPPLIKGLRIRAGRTELSYGNERLIGRNDFGLTGQAFDGVLVTWESPAWFQIDLFYTKLRESRDDSGDKDFMGAYLTTTAVPYTTIDVYGLMLFDELARSVDSGETKTFKSQILTTGVRAEALLFDQLHIEAEAVFQFGKRTEPVKGDRELDHFATAYYAEISYQAPIPTQPTIGAFFVQASGDQNALDDKSVDFLPLFPTRHSFLGTMDLFSWTNIRDFGGKLELTPPWNFGFFAAFHYLQLATDRGSSLPGFGTGKTPDPTTTIGRNIGWEVDAAISWAPNDELQVQVGYSYFNPSTVTKELAICGAKAASGTCDAAQWAYFQTRVKF